VCSSDLHQGPGVPSPESRNRAHRGCIRVPPVHDSGGSGRCASLLPTGPGSTEHPDSPPGTRRSVRLCGHGARDLARAPDTHVSSPPPSPGGHDLVRGSNEWSSMTERDPSTLSWDEAWPEPCAESALLAASGRDDAADDGHPRLVWHEAAPGGDLAQLVASFEREGISELSDYD